MTPHTVFEVFDSITKVAGKHTLKFGPEIRADRNNEWLRPQQTSRRSRFFRRTSLHGYFGLFYMPMQFGFGLTTNIPEYSTYSVLFPAPYPTPNPPLPPGTQNISIFPRSPRDPYSTNWLFGIQQQLAPRTVLTVNYTGNKTQHMQAGIDFAAVNLNPSNPSNGLPPLANFASENLDADALSSNYNAMQVQLRRNAGRLTLEANYTWSHEIDDLVNVFGGWSNPFNPAWIAPAAIGMCGTISLQVWCIAWFARFSADGRRPVFSRSAPAFPPICN